MNPSSMIRAVLSPSRGAVHGRSVGPWAMMGHALALMATTSHQRPGPHHGGRFRIQRAVPLFRSASPPSPRRRVRNSVTHIPLPRAEAAISTRTEPAAGAVHRSLPHRRGTAHTATCSESDLQRASERHPGLSSPSPSPTRPSSSCLPSQVFPSLPPSSHHRKFQPNHRRGRACCCPPLYLNQPSATATPTTPPAASPASSPSPPTIHASKRRRLRTAATGNCHPKGGGGSAPRCRSSTTPPPRLSQPEAGFDPLDPDADPPPRLLTADELRRCNKALKALENKLGKPAKLAKEFYSLPVYKFLHPPPPPLFRPPLFSPW